MKDKENTVKTEKKKLCLHMSVKNKLTKMF